MQDIIQIIIAIIGGGGLTIGIQRLNLLRSDKRSGNAEAERKELENDDIRFEGYKATINDLNERMEEALKNMRKLEQEVTRVTSENTALKLENATLKAENEKLKKELNRGKKTK